MRNTLMLAVLCLVSQVCWAQAIEFPDPPRLATTRAELEQRKQQDDFATVKERALAAADKLLAQPLEVPDGPGNWIFYYANPRTGGRLKALSLTEHVDPATGEVFTDERTIASYRTVLHNRVDSGVLTLGWAYAYSGDDRYAAEVRRLLLKLADDYPNYPDRFDRWGRTGMLARLGARRYAQSLDEAYGVISLAKGYDLTRLSPVWSEADHTKVQEQFFRLTAQTLLRFNQDINNHQTWYNAGLMCIASVLADEKLIEQVRTMRGGFEDQMQRSIGSDGLWYEGTIAYHNYALQAMIEIADVARRLGLNWHEHPKFRLLFVGPLNAAYPNGQFPAINDSDYATIGNLHAGMAWAAQVWGDELFVQAQRGGKELQLTQDSMVLSDAGLAILRQGEGERATCAMIDFGAHGGGHGHYDKLNLVLYANGREWLLDPGRLSYSHSEYKTWVKHTAAHNTVALGGVSQLPGTGRLLWFEKNDQFAACATESTGSYLLATLRRYVLLTDRMLVDVYQVTTPAPVQMDWFAHAVGDQLAAPSELGAGQPTQPGSSNGYQHLTEAVSWSSAGSTRWQFTAGDLKLGMLLIEPADQEQLIRCVGIGYNVKQKTPTLIRRRHGNGTIFASVFDLSGDDSYVKSAAMGEQPGVMTVQLNDGGTWRIEFSQQGVSGTLTP